MCLEPRSALAQDWQFESALSQRMGYQTNILLQPDHEIDGFSSQTTPEITLKRTSPTSEIELNGLVRYTAYIDNSDLSSFDQFARLNASKALSERSTLGFKGRFDRDTTLDSEEDRTGRFVNDKIRLIRWDATPTWQYLLSPIDKLGLSAHYSQVDYDSLEKTDYRDYGPTVSYSHDLSELASITGSLNYSRFEADDFVNRTQDTYGGLLGYDYHPTERFTVGGGVGLNYNVTHQDDAKDKGDVSYRFMFNLDYLINDQTKATVALSRDTEPSGDAEAVTRNSATVSLSYQMTELTTFTFDTSYVDDQETLSEDGVSRYLTVRPAVRWDITEDLTLSANYQFRYKNVETEGSAFDNGAFITLRYALPDVNWSGF
jgi:hypothetical protein